MSDYASVDDVKARAGVLRAIFNSGGGAPDDAEIDRFIEDASAMVDAKLTALGAAVPLTGATALGAVRPMVADAPAVLALEAAFPGGSRPADASQLIDALRARSDQAWASLMSGDAAIVVLVEADADETGALGASSFWTDEPNYGLGLTATDRMGLNPYLAPTFEKTEKL